MNTTSTPCTSHCFTKTISTLFVLIIGIGIGTFAGYQYSCSMDNTMTTIVQPGAVAPLGYLIGNYTITDQKTYDEYLNKAGPLTTPYGGKAIVFDLNVERLEGTPKQLWWW